MEKEIDAELDDRNSLFVGQIKYWLLHLNVYSNSNYQSLLQNPIDPGLQIVPSIHIAPLKFAPTYFSGSGSLTSNKVACLKFAFVRSDPLKSAPVRLIFESGALSNLQFWQHLVLIKFSQCLLLYACRSCNPISNAIEKQRENVIEVFIISFLWPKLIYRRFHFLQLLQVLFQIYLFKKGSKLFSALFFFKITSIFQ